MKWDYYVIGDSGAKLAYQKNTMVGEYYLSDIFFALEEWKNHEKEIENFPSNKKVRKDFLDFLELLSHNDNFFKEVSKYKDFLYERNIKEKEFNKKSNISNFSFSSGKLIP